MKKSFRSSHIWVRHYQILNPYITTFNNQSCIPLWETIIWSIIVIPTLVKATPWLQCQTHYRHHLFLPNACVFCLAYNITHSHIYIKISTDWFQFMVFKRQATFRAQLEVPAHTAFSRHSLCPFRYAKPPSPPWQWQSEWFFLFVVKYPDHPFLYSCWEQLGKLSIGN
jgi:hypothetical protein